MTHDGQGFPQEPTAFGELLAIPLHAHGVTKERAQELAAYLMQSCASDRPALFAEYVAWRRSQERRDARGLSSVERAVEALLANPSSLPQDIASFLGQHRDAIRARLAGVTSPGECAIDRTQTAGALAGTLFDSLLAGDRWGAAAALKRAMDDGLDMTGLYLHVLWPMLTEVGRRWQMNTLTIGQEHYCTAAVQWMMANLPAQVLRKKRDDRCLVAANIAGNLHDVGNRMLVDLFDQAGWTTHFLGADCPTDDLVDFAAEQQARIIAVSVSMTAQLPEVEQLIRTLRQRRKGRGMKVLVGGSVFAASPGLWADLGADATADNVADAVPAAETLLDGPVAT